MGNVNTSSSTETLNQIIVYIESTLPNNNTDVMLPMWSVTDKKLKKVKIVLRPTEITIDISVDKTRGYYETLKSVVIKALQKLDSSFITQRVEISKMMLVRNLAEPSNEKTSLETGTNVHVHVQFKNHDDFLNFFEQAKTKTESNINVGAQEDSLTIENNFNQDSTVFTFQCQKSKIKYLENVLKFTRDNPQLYNKFLSLNPRMYNKFLSLISGWSKSRKTKKKKSKKKQK